jgi:hypothetical protein
VQAESAWPRTCGPAALLPRDGQEQLTVGGGEHEGLREEGAVASRRARAVAEIESGLHLAVALTALENRGCPRGTLTRFQYTLAMQGPKPVLPGVPTRGPAGAAPAFRRASSTFSWAGDRGSGSVVNPLPGLFVFTDSKHALRAPALPVRRHAGAAHRAGLALRRDPRRHGCP